MTGTAGKAYDCEQGTPEWHAARCGKVTASRISDMLARTKSGWGASRANYMTELLLERLTGTQQEGFCSAEMRWGKEKEPEAVAAYEFKRNVDTTKVAFVDHPTIAMSGCSPDRLVGADGILELKCPLPKQHLAWLRAGTLPPEYAHQVWWQLACTGRAWCDFASYHPHFPDAMRLFVVRVARDATQIVRIETEVRTFQAELDEQMRDVARLFPSVVPTLMAAE